MSVMVRRERERERSSSCQRSVAVAAAWFSRRWFSRRFEREREAACVSRERERGECVSEGEKRARKRERGGLLALPSGKPPPASRVLLSTLPGSVRSGSVGGRGRHWSPPPAFREREREREVSVR